MKRDLNLVPKSDSPPIITKYVLPIMLFVILYLSAIYMAWSIPSERLHTKKAEDAAIYLKVDELAYVEIEYQELRAKLKEIEARKETILQTTDTEKSAFNILSILEKACPVDITLDIIELSKDGITIEGSSTSDSIIAEFAVNLRAVELFTNVNISSVEPNELLFSDFQQAQSGGIDTDEKRVFAITLIYYVEPESIDESEGDGA